jgi:hypothetical protein
MPESFFRTVSLHPVILVRDKTENNVCPVCQQSLIEKNLINDTNDNIKIVEDIGYHETCLNMITSKSN